MLTFKSKQFPEIASVCTCIWSNVERTHLSTKSTQSDYKWINQPNRGGREEGDEGTVAFVCIGFVFGKFCHTANAHVNGFSCSKIWCLNVFSQVIAFDYHLLSTKSNKLFQIAQIHFKIYSLKCYTKTHTHTGCVCLATFECS